MKNLTLAPKGNANKSKPDRRYPAQGPGHQSAKKDGTKCQQCQTPMSGMYQELMSFCHITEKTVRLDPKKDKRKQVFHNNSHTAWNNLDTSNRGKAQGAECWSRRLTPTRTCSIQKLHTLCSLYLEKTTICHVLSYFHGPSARVGLFKSTATVWAGLSPTIKGHPPSNCCTVTWGIAHTF